MSQWLWIALYLIALCAAGKAPVYSYDGTVQNRTLVNLQGNYAYGQYNFAGDNALVALDCGPLKDGNCLDLAGQGWFTFPFAPITSNAFTISLWVNVYQNNGGSTFFTFWSNDGLNQFSFGQSSAGYFTGSLFQANGQAINLVSLYTMPIRQWNHVVASADPQTNVFSIFVNGKRVATASYDGTIKPVSGYFYVGASLTSAGSPSTTPLYLSGLIDSISVYDYALSYADLFNLYTKQGKNILPIYAYDSTVVNGVVLDAMGRANGTYNYPRNNFTTSAVNSYDNAMDFTAGGWLAFSPYTEIKSQSLTLSVWFYLRNYTAWGTFLKHWTSSVNGQFHFGLDATSTYVSCYVTMGAGLPREALYNYQGPNLNTWTHYAITLDGSAAPYWMLLYINGLPMAATTFDGTIKQNTGIPFFSAGAKLDAPATPSPSETGYLNGQLDNIFIYDRALDRDTLLQLWQAQRKDGR